VANRTKESDAAYAAFVEAAWPKHLRLALLLTGDRWRAEDLLQDSLVRIYERWRRLARTGDLDAYLRKVLVNNHTSMWRRRRRERLFAEVPDHPVETGPSADAIAVRDALRALPARQRAVVVLRHYEDLPEREVAAVLGCTVGTVKSQHAKALAKLRHSVQIREAEPRREKQVSR
jgi:RNA polymerase sigma-70 factor (sigma-E family)